MPGSAAHSDVTPRQPGRGAARLGGLARFVGLFAVAALAIVASPLGRRGERVFLTLENLGDVLRQVSEKGILAVGMTIVVLTGGIDLSVGSTLALSASASAVLLTAGGWSAAASASFVLASGLSLGALSGLAVSLGRLPP